MRCSTSGARLAIIQYLDLPDSTRHNMAFELNSSCEPEQWCTAHASCSLQLIPLGRRVIEKSQESITHLYNRPIQVWAVPLRPVDIITPFLKLLRSCRSEELSPGWLLGVRKFMRVSRRQAFSSAISTVTLSILSCAPTGNLVPRDRMCSINTEHNQACS